MTDDLETVYHFARADAGFDTTLGAFTLRLRHWRQERGQQQEMRMGLTHRLTQVELQDLIAHLQHVLDHCGSATGPSSDGAARH